MPRITGHRVAAAVAVAAVAGGAGVLGNASAATPSYAAAQTSATATSSQTLTVSAPAGAAPGKVLVAVVTFRLDSAAAVSAPSGWSDVVRTSCTTTSSPLSQAIFVRAATSAEPSSYTFTLASSTGAVGAVLAYTGVDTTQPVAASAGAVTRNSKGITASLITTSSPVLLVGTFAHSGRSVISAPSGMTSRTDATTGASAPSARAITADQLLTTTGTQSRTAQAQAKNTCNVSQLVALRPGPDAPVSTSPPTVTGLARQGQLLSASTGSWSGSPTSYAYQWERCDAGGGACTAVPSARNASYPLAGADVGFTLRVVVTAANAGGSASAASAPTAMVVPDPPLNLAPPVISGTPRDGESLTASTGSWARSPTSFAYLWQWSSDGGSSWNGISATGAVYTPTAADVGSTVRVVVTASNAGGSASEASAPTDVVTPAVPPANVELPTIIGAAQEGATLTVDLGTWTGSPFAYAYQWETCEQDGVTCTPIAGAEAAEYTPTTAVIGLRLRVVVSASNSGGTGSASSLATVPVLVAAPANTSPPLVSGLAYESETLAASTGDWLGNPTSFAFVWQRCDESGANCSSVTWADTDTYRLREQDVGLTIRVVVTATNEGGPTSASSATTAVVIPLPPVNETTPTTSGVLEEGEVLNADTGTWLSSGALSYEFQWQRSIDGGASWSDIDQATGPTYQLASIDVGTVIRVVVTASNAGGSASMPSSATAAISAPGGPVNIGPPTFAGSLQPGRTLDADSGAWSGSPTSYTYQWQLSGDRGQRWTDIVSATATSLTLTTAHVGSDVRVLVTAHNALGSGAAPSPGAKVYPTGNLVALANQLWRCNTSVNVDLVKVTLWTREADAVTLATGCTGRIGRVEVETWTFDALKTVNSSTNAAHDLVVESGYAICHDRTPGLHQDGWQSMGGARITVRNFVWACGDMNDPYGSSVAQSVVIGRAGANVTTPTDTVVEHSVLMPGAAHSFALGESLRSGIRGSVVCPDRTGSSPFTDLGGAVDPIYEAIEEPPASDPLCSSFATAIAWAQGTP